MTGGTGHRLGSVAGVNIRELHWTFWLLVAAWFLFEGARVERAYTVAEAAASESVTLPVDR